MTGYGRSRVYTSLSAFAFLGKQVSTECTTPGQLTSTGNLDPLGCTLVGFHLWHYVAPLITSLLFTSNDDAEVSSCHLWLMFKHCIVFKKKGNPFDHLVS